MNPPEESREEASESPSPLALPSLGLHNTATEHCHHESAGQLYHGPGIRRWIDFLPGVCVMLDLSYDFGICFLSIIIMHSVLREFNLNKLLTKSQTVHLLFVWLCSRLALPSWISPITSLIKDLIYILINGKNKVVLKWMASKVICISAILVCNFSINQCRHSGTTFIKTHSHVRGKTSKYAFGSR